MFAMNKTTRFILIGGFLAASALISILVSSVAMQAGEERIASWCSKAALLFALLLVIYVLPRLAKSFRLDALRTELNTRLFASAWLFLGALLVVGTLALVTVNNLLYLVFSVLGATFLVCAVACRFNLSRLDVTLRFPDHIYAGETARFEVTVHNRKRILPTFSLSIASALPSRLAHFSLLSPRSSSRSSFTHDFPKRGIYPLRGFSMRSRFPFGLMERRRFVNSSGEVVVYPNPEVIDDFYHLLPFTQGQKEMPARGRGTDLYAIRQYLSSDHPHHINWKATAKTSRMMVREFARDDDWRVTIALDEGHPHEDADPQQFERAVTLAASLISHFGAEGAEVRLITAKEDSSFGSGQSHQLDLLRILAGAQQTVVMEGEDITERIPALVADERFKILITPAERGSLPAHLWRTAHVIYFDDMNPDNFESLASAIQRGLR